MPTPLTDPQKEHVIREWEKLNKELEKLLEETRTREKYSITIIAGVAGWVLLHPVEINHTYKITISLVPLVTTTLFGISVLFLYQNIKWIGAYLAQIENYFLGANDYHFGWETALDKVNKKHYFVNLTKGMWIAQLVIAIPFSVFVISSC
jgi:ABC-type sulfate transport system permease component